jgi:hypothetical protein
MRLTNLFIIILLLASPVQFTIAQASHSPQTSAPLTDPVVASAASHGSAAVVAEADEIARWLIMDDESLWSADETEVLQRVLDDTFETLEVNGIDGIALLDGYRFRHESGPYVGNVEGRMGVIDHNTGEITLSDRAFTVLKGFPIYHELGHAVDYRLNRQLSAGFHSYTGGAQISEDGYTWQTADNSWLRAQGRYDREEATADSFAVLVMSHAGIKPPVFAGQPATTDYENISAAVAHSLRIAK